MPPNCADGQILSYQASSQSWICIDFSTIIDQDSDGVLAWNDCDDNDTNAGSSINDRDCDTVLDTDDCDDNNPNSTIIATDGDCDGVLTADDCNDNNPSLLYVDGQTASCPASSCLEIFTNNLSVGDGQYYLNVGGATLYTCDMTNGGWTVLTNETFSGGANSWGGSTTSCGSFGTILGGYGQFGTGASTNKTFSSPFTHSQYSISFNFIRIDSWDGESGLAYVDGSQVWSRAGSGSNGSQICGSGNGGWNEESWSGSATGSHSASTINVRFSSSLDQDPSDESWGVDNIIVKVK
jgi:hypothetical protein